MDIVDKSIQEVSQYKAVDKYQNSDVGAIQLIITIYYSNEIVDFDLHHQNVIRN